MAPVRVSFDHRHRAVVGKYAVGYSHVCAVVEVQRALIEATEGAGGNLGNHHILYGYHSIASIENNVAYLDQTDVLEAKSVILLQLRSCVVGSLLGAANQLEGHRDACWRSSTDDHTLRDADTPRDNVGALENRD